MSHNGKSKARRTTELVGPYALTAGRGAVRGARWAGGVLGPRARRLVGQARTGLTTQLAPRVGRAVAAAGPAGREATARSQAALAAVRAEVTAEEILELARRKRARARNGRLVRRIGLAGLVAGGAYLAWRWWNGQSDPDWLMEPSPATEAAESRPAPTSEAEAPSPNGSAGSGEPGAQDEDAREKEARETQAGKTARGKGGDAAAPADPAKTAGHDVSEDRTQAGAERGSRG